MEKISQTIIKIKKKEEKTQGTNTDLDGESGKGPGIGGEKGWWVQKFDFVGGEKHSSAKRMRLPLHSQAVGRSSVEVKHKFHMSISGVGDRKRIA